MLDLDENDGHSHKCSRDGYAKAANISQAVGALYRISEVPIELICVQVSPPMFAFVVTIDLVFLCLCLLTFS